MRTGERLLTEDQIRWALDKWCLGYTYLDISLALGCCQKTIQRVFQERGYKKVRPVLRYPE